MGKSDKAEIKRLKKKVKALKKRIKAATAPAPAVSPLAPKGGFPSLPAIKGLRFAAGAAGVKYSGRDDVMLAEIAPGSAVAGVFTKSSTRSAPVLDCQAKLAMPLSADKPLAILVNSGNSNAFTGSAGEKSVAKITDTVAQVLGTDPSHVFTASTGVIGERLPHDRIVAKVQELQQNLTANAIEPAARAIMTTDTFAKGASTQIELDGKTVSISGFAKGSGMIAPDMATMLVYIFTDAAIAQDVLQTMLSSLNETTFNAITVDSDTSTSDTLMVVATGQSGAPKIVDKNSNAAQELQTALGDVMRQLSHLVVKDGEGASKFVAVTVTGAQDDASAKRIALSIANSPLVKTAIAGQDPNWGRVVMAVGKSGEPADRDQLTIRFGDILVAEKGWVAKSYTEELGSDYMKGSELTISTDVGIGNGASTVWTCDLTHQYITINADYRS